MSRHDGTAHAKTSGMDALKARVRRGTIVVDGVEDREALLRAVREGIADADAGRVVDDAEARERLEAKFGPLAS